jgi:hypothetical protein
VPRVGAHILVPVTNIMSIHDRTRRLMAGTSSSRICWKTSRPRPSCFRRSWRRFIPAGWVAGGSGWWTSWPRESPPAGLATTKEPGSGCGICALSAAPTLLAGRRLPRSLDRRARPRNAPQTRTLFSAPRTWPSLSSACCSRHTRSHGLLYSLLLIFSFSPWSWLYYPSEPRNCGRAAAASLVGAPVIFGGSHRGSAKGPGRAVAGIPSQRRFGPVLHRNAPYYRTFHRGYPQSD